MGTEVVPVSYDSNTWCYEYCSHTLLNTHVNKSVGQKIVQKLSQKCLSFLKKNSLQKCLMLIISSDNRHLYKMKGEVGPLHPLPSFSFPSAQTCSTEVPALSGFSFTFSTNTGTTMSFHMSIHASSYKLPSIPQQFTLIPFSFSFNFSHAGLDWRQ